MKAIDKLIELGFNFSVDQGNIKMEYKGSNPAPASEVMKPLLGDIKLNKRQAIQYIESLIVYSIPCEDNKNFESQVQACLENAYCNNIRWLRCDVYRKSKRVVLSGVFMELDLVEVWKANLKEVSKDSEYYMECPWINQKAV